ncbi:MAG: hypothetical protein FD178_3694 [Ignavibacteria bacterium]|nr:MAG: hypothetical protein FD178_3694 [Ignavibacteria bacterium]
MDVLDKNAQQQKEKNNEANIAKNDNTYANSGQSDVQINTNNLNQAGDSSFTLLRNEYAKYLASKISQDLLDKIKQIIEGEKKNQEGAKKNGDAIGSGGATTGSHGCSWWADCVVKSSS